MYCNPKNPKRFLIIQLRRLGDVLLTTPVIDVLKEHFPDAQVDFLTEEAFVDVLVDNPKLSTIFILNKDSWHEQLTLLRRIRKNKYDYVLDFFGNPRSSWWSFFSGAKKRVGYTYPVRQYLYNIRVTPDPRPKYVIDFKMDLLKPLGIPTTRRTMSLQVAPDVQKKMRDFLCAHGWDGKKKLVAILTPNVRKRSMVKNWRMDGYVTLAERVQQECNAAVVIIWGPGEEEDAYAMKRMTRGDNVIVAPQTTVREHAALVSLCSMLVTGCSGPKHIAVALGVPTVTIFGPTQEVCWNPPNNPKHIAVKADIPCIACDKTACETMECMKRVSVDMVMNAVKRIMNGG